MYGNLGVVKVHGAHTEVLPGAVGDGKVEALLKRRLDRVVHDLLTSGASGGLGALHQGDWGLEALLKRRLDRVVHYL